MNCELQISEEIFTWLGQVGQGDSEGVALYIRKAERDNKRYYNLWSGAKNGVLANTKYLKVEVVSVGSKKSKVGTPTFVLIATVISIMHFVGQYSREGDTVHWLARATDLWSSPAFWPEENVDHSRMIVT